MSITNLLAQGFNPLPAEIQQNALMAGQQMQERRMRNALLQQQMQAAQEERAAQQRNALLMQDAINAIPSPQMQASQQALAGGGGPTVANAARMPAVDPRLQALHGLMQASGGKLVSPVDYLKTAMPEPEKPRDVVVGNTLVRTQGGKATPLFTAQKENPFIEQMRAAGIDPASPEGQSMLRQRLEKEATHAQGVNVTFGSPMPAVNPKTGKVELVRPDNKGGMAWTGVEPPPQNRDVKPPAEIQRMNIAIDTMGKLLDDYETMLKRHNPRDPMVQANPAVRAEFQSLMKGIQLQFKEVQALGALAGPDLAIMEAAITDPFTFRGVFYGKDGLLGQINQSRKLLATRKQATTDNVQGGGAKPSAPAANDDPLGLRGGK